jgi:hypothetical protein
MADKRSKRLVREGEPSEKTRKGLEVPIPKRGEFFRNLRRVAKADDSETKGGSTQ